MRTVLSLESFNDVKKRWADGHLTQARRPHVMIEHKLHNAPKWACLSRSYKQQTQDTIIPSTIHTFSARHMSCIENRETENRQTAVRLVYIIYLHEVGPRLGPLLVYRGSVRSSDHLKEECRTGGRDKF